MARRASSSIVPLFALFAAAGGCAASAPQAPESAPAVQQAKQVRAECELGTLGMEATPLTEPLRRRLGLPAAAKGVAVTEVLAGGPAAAAAGIRKDDVVERIGGVAIANDCDFIVYAFERTCDPVRVVLRRGGESIEQELVPADHEAFYPQHCREGGATGCYRHARTLWGLNRGDGRERAMRLYRMACQRGSAAACAEEGLHLTNAPERGREAVASLERACELAEGSGCAHLAFLYASGTIVARDDVRAMALYVKSCNLDDPRGCYNVALMADQGRSGARGGARDGVLALAKYRQGCEMGSSSACTNLGFLYENGRGVKLDPSHAVALYKRGCAGTTCEGANLAGCLNVGRAYRDGMGVAKDPAQAAAIFADACERTPDPHDPGAAGSRARACSLLGALYLAGTGVEKDNTRGRELSELGCADGDSFGCYNAAAVYSNGTGVAADTAKAATFLDLACQAGDGEGCHDLAVAYQDGSGVEPDRQRATALFRKACELEFEPACARAPK